MSLPSPAIPDFTCCVCLAPSAKSGEVGWCQFPFLIDLTACAFARARKEQRKPALTRRKWGTSARKVGARGGHPGWLELCVVGIGEAGTKCVL